MPISFEERHWLASFWVKLVIASGVSVGVWATAGAPNKAMPNSAAARYLPDISLSCLISRIEPSMREDTLGSSRVRQNADKGVPIGKAQSARPPSVSYTH